MEFEPTESQRKLVEMVRDFCVREVKPRAAEWDRNEQFPREVVAHLGELGLLGMAVPEELGGSQLDTVSLAMVVEEIARWDGSLALTVASHNGLGTSHILRFGSDELLPLNRTDTFPTVTSRHRKDAGTSTRSGSAASIRLRSASATCRWTDWTSSGR